MVQLRRKLNSRSGASMMLALLFLFFCLTVGAVVLTAASASAGRIERNRREQQNYLAVQSAANLLMDDLADMKYTGTYIYRYKTYYHTRTDSEGNTHSYTTNETERDSKKELTGTRFQTLMEDEFQKLFLSSPILSGYRAGAAQAPTPVTFEWTVTGEDGAGKTAHGLPAVKVTLTLGDPSQSGAASYTEEGYTITAVLALAEPGSEGNHAMTVVFHPDVAEGKDHQFESGNPDVETTTITAEVTWTKVEITKGAATWES